MRVRVASTGGETGSTSAGKAERRSARYSATGSTTHPSPAMAAFCARPAVATMASRSVKQNSLTMIDRIDVIAEALLAYVDTSDGLIRKLSRFLREASVRIGIMFFLLSKTCIERIAWRFIACNSLVEARNSRVEIRHTSSRRGPLETCRSESMRSLVMIETE